MLSVQTKPNQGGDNLASPSISSAVIASVTISISSFISVSGWRTGDRRTLGGSGLSLKQTTSKSRGRDMENNTTNCCHFNKTHLGSPFSINIHSEKVCLRVSTTAFTSQAYREIQGDTLPPTFTEKCQI